MPAEQRGSVYGTSKGWGVRWIENGRRRHHSGFKSRTDACNYFRDEVRPRLANESDVDPHITLSAFVELYLADHQLNIEASSLTVIRSRLRAATAKFGDVELRHLERQVAEIAAWRSALADGSRFGSTQALRQCLDKAIAWGVLLRNPARLASDNPRPKRTEIVPFTKDEIDKLCDEIGTGAQIIRFAAATGLRPCEWIALERRDIRRDDGVILVERSFSRRQLSAYGKTARSRRRVPLSRIALDALAAVPPRLDSPLVFTSAEGRRIDLDTWRKRDWTPALEASGIGHGTVYTLRHTAITNMIAAGIGLFEVARYAGTSLQMIDQTYGHLQKGAEQAAAAKLDAAGSGV